MGTRILDDLTPKTFKQKSLQEIIFKWWPTIPSLDFKSSSVNKNPNLLSRFKVRMKNNVDYVRNVRDCCHVNLADENILLNVVKLKLNSLDIKKKVVVVIAQLLASIRGHYSV